MERETLEIGQIVRAAYKTGEYIGEVADMDGRRVLVKVLAVLQHPTQGDLHSAQNPDAAMFHERPASAYNEKVWAMAGHVLPYGGEVPPYKESLLAALEAEMAKMDRLRRWSAQCCEILQSLGKTYGR